MELVTTRDRVPPRGRLAVQPPSGRPSRLRRLSDGRRTGWLTAPRLGLIVLLAVTLALRLWGIKQGLPFSYNADEAEHFVPRAIGFFSGSWDPRYFLNPPGYSYLLAIVFEGWFGSADAVVRSFTLDPTSVFVVARVTCAVMGTAAVGLLYVAGRRLLDQAGAALLGAAVFGLAFLPIFYSHLALNDVPTLFWVCVALVGVAGIWRDGRRRDYLLAGAGLGVAAATKYTGGWVLIPMLVAAAHDSRRSGTGAERWDPSRAVQWTCAALLLALLAFSAANPYWFLDFHTFISGLSQQAADTSGASEPAKLGTAPGGGILYYLWTFTWGLGLGPTLAALGGLALLVRRRQLGLLAIFVPGEIAFIVFMGLQVRYFGRWLMPVFPAVSLLAGYAGAEAVRGATGLRRPVPAWLAATLVAVGLLTQSVVSVLHNDAVLARPYTTNLARDWMIAHIPAGQNVYIEPVIPGNWTSDIGGSDAYEPNGARWYEYPTQESYLAANGTLLPHGERRVVTLDQYEKTLYPGLIAKLEAQAFCWVVSGTLQSGRAFVAPQQDPQAVAYYRELARVGTLVFSASPYGARANPVPFGFDWTIDYYPRQYRLPGPQVSIYHLSGGACASS